MMTIDLNCDMGESFGAYRIGADAEVMASIYVGERRVRVSRRRSRRDAADGAAGARRGVAVGAHPGFPDLAGFGRREMRVTPQEVEDLVLYQIGALAAIAQSEGVRSAAREGARRALQHGGPGSRACDGDRARGGRASIRRSCFFGLPGSELARAGRGGGAARRARGVSPIAPTSRTDR